MVFDAIRSALAQTTPNIQVLVQYCPLNWTTKLNEAVNASAGEFLVILCDDDLLAPTFVEKCLRFAENQDIVYTDRHVFRSGMTPTEGPIARYHSNMAPNGAYWTKLDYGDFAFGSPLPMTCLIRRSLWDKLKGYDEPLAHADTEFWFRAIRAKARLAYVAQPLFWYREHPAQLSALENSNPRAFREFHRKHRKVFGLTLAGTPDDKGNYAGRANAFMLHFAPAWEHFRERMRALQKNPPTVENDHVRV